MTISKLRSLLYGSAKVLGDVQAAEKAVKTQSLTPVGNRIARRMIGKMTGRLIGSLFR